MTEPEDFILFTGGPGAGKTTLLTALAQRGYPVMPEAGRAIIRHQRAIGGEALHTKDFRLAAELSLSWELRSHDEARRLTGPVLFDRGVPDLVGYYPLMGYPTPERFRRAAELYRYRPTAFIAPPWREIYVNDAERGQDWAEAVRSYEVLVDGYHLAGYQLIELPRVDTATRVAFVLDHLAGAG